LYCSYYAALFLLSSGNYSVSYCPQASAVLPQDNLFFLGRNTSLSKAEV